VLFSLNPAVLIVQYVKDRCLNRDSSNLDALPRHFPWPLVVPKLSVSIFLSEASRLACRRGFIFNSAAKIQHRHCGFRMFGHFFLKIFIFFSQERMSYTDTGAEGVNLF
jgi:hypothetical protein